MKTIWVVLCPLLFSTFALAQDGQRVDKIDLLIYTWQSLWANCGSNQGVAITLSNTDGQTCTVQRSRSFVGGDTLTWGNDNTQLNLNNCGSFLVQESTMVFLNTPSSYEDFCPNRVTIVKANGLRYESKMEEIRYNKQNNLMANPVELKGISRIFMTMAGCKNYDLRICGGHAIKVTIQTGLFHCTVETKPTVSAGELVVWERNELGNCGSMPISEETNVWLQTDAFNDQFIPYDLEIYMDDYINTNWRVRLGGKRFNKFENSQQKNTNNNRLSVVKTWPRDNYIQPIRDRPVTCPENETESCPASEMYAYRLRSTMQMNCIFECGLINETPFSVDLDQSDGSGQRCLVVGHISKQYDWCCRTKATSGGIPHCDNVLGRHQTTIVEEESIPPTHSECPNIGCPIDMLEGRRVEGTTKNACEPGCDYIYDESHLDCTELTRPTRKTQFCCNEPAANTTLPQCSSLISRRRDRHRNRNAGQPGRFDQNGGGQPGGLGQNGGGLPVGLDQNDEQQAERSNQRVGGPDRNRGIVDESNSNHDCPQSIIEDQSHPRYEECRAYWLSRLNLNNNVD